MCANDDYDIDELFQVLGWCKLKYQRFESAAVMMYKPLHGKTLEYLSSKFGNNITSHRFVPGCGTAYLVTFMQQHLYMILNLT